MTFAPVVVKQDFWVDRQIKSLFSKALRVLTHVGSSPLTSLELRSFLETITGNDRSILLPCIDLKNGEPQTWFRRNASAIDSDQWVATRLFTSQTTSSPLIGSTEMPFVEGAGEREWTLMRAALVLHPDGHVLLKNLISIYIQKTVKDETLQPILSDKSDFSIPF